MTGFVWSLERPASMTGFVWSLERPASMNGGFHGCVTCKLNFCPAP
jgi:predicted secreted protein